VTGRGDEIQGALVGNGSGEELKDRLGQREAEQTAARSSWRSRPAAHRGGAARLRHGHTSTRGLSLTGGRRQVRSHYREEEGTRHEAAQHGWTLTAAGPTGQAPPGLTWECPGLPTHWARVLERHPNGLKSPYADPRRPSKSVMAGSFQPAPRCLPCHDGRLLLVGEQHPHLDFALSGGNMYLSRLLAIAAVAATFACGGSTPTNPTSGGQMSNPPPSGTVGVTIQDFTFSPASLTIKAGTTVRWSNNGPSAHTTTSDAGAWSSGTLSPPSGGGGYGGGGSAGGTFDFTFTQPGNYPYHCSLHPPSMYPSFTGIVIVTP
jgi:plastocyanin